MSADNWAACPRCIARSEAELRMREGALKLMYGAVPLAEFEKARADLERDRQVPANRDYTFREDYGFYGADSGVVTVSYRGACNVCGLSLSFQEDHPIPGLESAE